MFRLVRKSQQYALGLNRVFGGIRLKIPLSLDRRVGIPSTWESTVFSRCPTTALVGHALVCGRLALKEDLDTRLRTGTACADHGLNDERENSLHNAQMD